MSQKYTVYDNKTDFPIVVCETAKACANAMGVTVGTFYKSVNHTNRANGNRWTVVKEGKCEELTAPPEKIPHTIGEFMKKCRIKKRYKTNRHSKSNRHCKMLFITI